MEWQPIETAAKDDGIVWLRDPVYDPDRWFLGYYREHIFDPEASGWFHQATINWASSDHATRITGSLSTNRASFNPIEWAPLT